MRTLEEFQNRQAFAEVCLNRHFQRAAGRGRHHAAHAGELGNLRNGTTSAGIRHHADRVELVHVVHDLALDVVRRSAPDLDDALVALFVGEQAALELLFNCADFLF